MTEEEFSYLNEEITTNFPDIKFIFTTQIRRNITDPNEQNYLILTEHNRAHRNYRENSFQLERNYFFPQIRMKTKAYAKQCQICHKQKFDTHPTQHILKPTPIPKYVGEYLQIDIFHFGKKIFYSTIDRFSKYVFLRSAPNKLNAHEVITEILQLFPNCKNCMTDNESIFTSFAMKALFKENNITHVLTPIRHSTSNAQIERIHRTLIEISRCLAEEKSMEIEDLILDAVKQYNNSIHSVIKNKPIDVFFHQEKYPEITSLLISAQNAMF